MLVRFQTDPGNVWRQSSSFYSEGQLRKRETRWTGRGQLCPEPGKPDDDGFVREMEFFHELHRRESQSRATQSVGSNCGGPVAFEKRGAEFQKCLLFKLPENSR